MNLDVKSLSPHEPEIGSLGDCYRCAVAAILGKEAYEVPHFFHDGCGGEEGIRRAREYLAGEGFGLAMFAYDGECPLDQILAEIAYHMPQVPAIFSGTSRAGGGHSVVILNGRIVYDSSGNGIIGPLDGYWWVEVLTKRVENDDRG